MVSLLKICWTRQHKASLVQREVAARRADGGIVNPPASLSLSSPLVRGGLFQAINNRSYEIYLKEMYSLVASLANGRI